MESQNADSISSNPIHQHDGEVKKHVTADRRPPTGNLRGKRRGSALSYMDEEQEILPALKHNESLNEQFDCRIDSYLRLKKMLESFADRDRQRLEILDGIESEIRKGASIHSETRVNETDDDAEVVPELNDGKKSKKLVDVISFKTWPIVIIKATKTMECYLVCLYRPIAKQKVYFRIPLHFDDKSMETFIGENLKLVTYGNSVGETDHHLKTILSEGCQVRLRKELKKYSSTNEYLTHEDNLLAKFIAMFVIILQFGGLITLCISLFDVDSDKPDKKDSVMMSIFIVPVIAIFLACAVVELMSEALVEKLLDLMESMTNSDTIAYLKFDICGGNLESIENYCLAFCAMIGYLPVQTFHVFLEMFSYIKGDSWDLEEFWRIVSALSEYLLIITSVGTTCLVLKSDLQPLSLLFNFAGVMVLLELDNKLATLLPFKSYEEFIELVGSKTGDHGSHPLEEELKQTLAGLVACVTVLYVVISIGKAN